MKIKKIHSREILSSSGSPTIETSVFLADGTEGRASVPYGVSSGKYEAVTLSDNDPNRFIGMGMLKAVRVVNEIIAPVLIGREVYDQKEVDSLLISLDQTPRKENLGGNSILSTSLATARAASISKSTPLYKHIMDSYGISGEINELPKPMMVLMEGGKHADSATDFQEYMLAVIAKMKSKEAVRAGSEIYHHLGKILDNDGHDINIGSEGAYAAVGFKLNEDPLSYINAAIDKAGYKRASQVAIAIDPAASEFFESGSYNFDSEDRKLSSSQLISYYKDLIDKYGLFSIEDGLAEDDWNSWSSLFALLGERALIVGDDLTVTQKKLLQKAIDLKAVNSVIIKPNQVGTLSETLDTVKLAKENALKLIVSHRGGGETTDTFMIDLAVAISADFVKVGPSRGERTDKYNRLMEIGEELNL